MQKILYTTLCKKNKYSVDNLTANIFCTEIVATGTDVLCNVSETAVTDL
ncbi:hypothetical protein [Lysinibacillus sp. G4S2]|nr:hypothetical protein [Lysinibacillus sp. G4S2]MDM5251053.1 hypothetical protein [Lysinibacillus sp. G4S2]